MGPCLTREELRAVLSDEPAAPESKSASAHLNDCAQCQALADELSDDRELRHDYLQCRAAIDFESVPIDLFSSDPMVGSTMVDTPRASPPSTELLGVPPTTLGRYQVKSPISRGAFGEVWRAYDPILDRDVAVKLVRQEIAVDPRYREGFLAEGKKLAALEHPGIVKVFDVGTFRGYTYIVTELLTGGTLSSWMQSNRLPFRDTARIVAAIARAAHAAHLKGLVHRDIKPGNIIINASGDPRLADFGLAVSEQEQLEEGPGSVGTLPYMSPEQVTGRSHLVDARTDIYSLGVVLYRALTGKLPFENSDHERTRMLIELKDPRPPRTIDDHIPADLEAICLKCLRKEPSDRYTTALDLAEALEQGLHPPPASGRRNLTSTDAATPASGTQQANSTASDVPPQPVADAGEPPRSNRRTMIGWAAAAASCLILLAALAIPDESDDGRQQVLVRTTPAGARVVVYPLDRYYGLPDGSRRAEADGQPLMLSLEPGVYLVVAALPDGRFHEVYRTVPENRHARPHSYPHRLWQKRTDGSIEWPVIDIPALDTIQRMALFTGDPAFQIGMQGNTTTPMHTRAVPAFYLDAHEVTWDEYRAANGDTLLPSQEHLQPPLPDGKMPISRVWWDDAVMHAEKIGKRLPTEAEFEFAATLGGTRKFPWGDEPPAEWEWTFGPAGHVDYDRVDVGAITVSGLYSNFTEWTASRATLYPPLPEYEDSAMELPTDTFIVRGGPSSVVLGDPIPEQFPIGPRQRIAQPRMSLETGIGFRCARSARPRLEVADLEQIVTE